MKVFIALFVVCCAVSVLGFTDEAKEEFKKHKEECIASSGATEDMVQNACKNGQFEEEEKLKEFFFCLMKKSEFMNDAGEYQIANIKTKLGAEIGEDVVDTVISECTKENHGSGPENAIELAKCYHEKVPKHSME